MIEAVTDPALLRRVHQEILAPSFPDTELVPLADFLALDRERGEVLVAREGETLQGAIVGEQVGAVMLVGWLAVGPAGRGGGVGGDLLDTALSRWSARPGVRLVLGEVERPDLFGVHPAHGDPRRRLAFYGRRGALALDMPYFQPPIGDGMPRQHGLLLLALAADAGLVPRRLDAGEVAAVRGYLSAVVGEPTDADAARVFAAVDAPGGLALLPLQEYERIAVTGEVTATG